MLQGSLENFSIPEILGLLASTNKTGRLKVSGDRGTGSVWCRDGLLELANASKLNEDAGLDDVMLELLRYGSGNFSFQADEALPEGAEAEAATVDSVLTGATTRLDEWYSIEEIVPSLEHSLTPAAELPGAEVTIKADEWEFLVAVGDSRTVGDVGIRLDLGEIDVSRRAKGLIERSLLDIGPNPGRRSADSHVAEPVEQPDITEELVADPETVETFVPEPITAAESAFTAEPAPQPIVHEQPIAEPAPVFDAAAGDPVVAPEPSFDADPLVAESSDGAPVAIEDMLASIAVNHSVENRSDGDDPFAGGAFDEQQASPFAADSGMIDSATADSGIVTSFDEPASFAATSPVEDEGHLSSGRPESTIGYSDFAKSAIGETSIEDEATFAPADPLPAAQPAPTPSPDLGDIASLRESMTADEGDEADSSVLMQFLSDDR